jgi:DNA primase
MEVYKMENDDSSIELSTVKYLIHIKFVIAGTAEKSDIIGAIFGQTEGLLGDSMDSKRPQELVEF